MVPDRDFGAGRNVLLENAGRIPGGSSEVAWVFPADVRHCNPCPALMRSASCTSETGQASNRHTVILHSPSSPSYLGHEICTE